MQAVTGVVHNHYEGTALKGRKSLKCQTKLLQILKHWYEQKV